MYIITRTMPSQETIYNVADRVATITLNRPDKLNAWTAIMEQEVRAAVEDAERDKDVRVIVLTGAGRGFCAGADISLLSTVATKGLGSKARAQVLRVKGTRRGARADFQKKYSYFAAVEKPVIAAINGPVVGLGLVITLYCDLRFASDAARFGTAFSRRGLIAEYGMAWMLPRIVGVPHALDLMFSARMIDAGEALRMGLVNQVYPQDIFLQKVGEYARDLNGLPLDREQLTLSSLRRHIFRPGSGNQCRFVMSDVAQRKSCSIQQRWSGRRWRCR